MLTAIELAAVITSALYGILLGLRKQFDFVGIFTVAFLVAFPLGSGWLPLLSGARAAPASWRGDTCPPATGCRSSRAPAS